MRGWLYVEFFFFFPPRFLVCLTFDVRCGMGIHNLMHVHVYTLNKFLKTLDL